MRALFAPVVVVAALSTASTAQAAEGSMWGGDLPAAPALHLEAGLPWLEIGYRMQLSDGFELMPMLKFSYFRYLAVNVAVVVGAEARFQLIDSGDFHGALTAAIPLQLIINQGVGFAIGLLYPGFAMDYVIADPVRLVFGFRFEDDLYIGGGGSFFIGTLPFFFGFETVVGDGITLGAKIEGGPAFAGILGTQGEVRALFGIDFPL